MSKKWQRIICAGLMVSCLGVLAACGGTGEKQSTEKTVRFGGSVAENLDSAKDWNGWELVRYGVGETLFRIGEDMKPEPWLAEKGENIDPLTWKITLKDKVTFSNGEKMTADKVIASLKRTAELNKRAVSLVGAEYQADGNVITVRTATPYATLLNDLCDPYAAILDVSGTKDFEKAPIGTGPFVIAAFEPKTKAVMKKSDKYWDGTAKLDGVEYTNIGDFNTLAMALQSGEIDIALSLSPEAAAAVEKNEKAELVKTTQPRVYQLYFNLEKMPDKAVREAIMYGVNKAEIGEKHLKGAMTPTYSPFLATTDVGERALNVRSFNAEKAREILLGAGYQDTNGDGILEKDGQPLKVKLSVYKRLAIENIATEMQAQLKKIGMDIEIEQHEKANFYAPGNFEMGLYSVVSTPTGEPSVFLRDAFLIGGKANYGKYANPEVQGYLEELPTVFDYARRVELMNKIQQCVIDDAAMDYIGFNTMLTGVSKSVIGYKTSANDYYQVTKDLDKK